MIDVVTVGSATIDAYASSDGATVRGRTLCFDIGTKISLSSLSYELGGGGTNAAYVCAMFGLHASFMGRVGNDFIGDEIVHRLARHGIDFVGERIDAQSAFSIILDAKRHDRTILAHKGASSQPFVHTDTSARMYYITSPAPDAIPMFAHNMGIVTKRSLVVFNPSSYLTRLGLDTVKPLLAHTDTLIFNKEECEMLTGKDTQRSLRILHALGPSIIIVTDGPRGCMVSDGTTIYTAPARKTNVLETTGAGDCFGATFASACLEGLDIPIAIDLALINSASVVTFPGPKRGVLARTELERLRASLPPLEISSHKVFK